MFATGFLTCLSLLFICFYLSYRKDKKYLEECSKAQYEKDKLEKSAKDWVLKQGYSSTYDRTRLYEGYIAGSKYHKE